MRRIVVLGAGFAGLWAALAAARARDAAAISGDDLEIMVVDAQARHSIRVRNYESDLSETCIPLGTVLDPVGVRHLQAQVTGIDVSAGTVTCASDRIQYDRLVVALGSQLARPAVAGLAEYGFDIDTYAAGERLNDHIATLAKLPAADGRYTVVVVGAGLTGIEAATDIATRFQSLPETSGARPRVILADHKPWIGSDMGEQARPVIAQALEALGVETLPGVSVTEVSRNGVTLANGAFIPTMTVVWCAGLKANPLAAALPGTLDRLGRIPVDSYLRVASAPGVFAAGDIAAVLLDGTHTSVMSCQHSRPMGRFAGNNAVADLLGRPMLPLEISWYTTILDLGGWGAVYTEGWDRQVVASGGAAKRTKEMINRQRIYPPLNGDRQALLDAAAPAVQGPPPRFAR